MHEQKHPPQETPKKKNFATPPEDMKTEHLECHTEKHWWSRAGDTNIVVGPGKIVLAFTRNYSCQRCGETKKIRRARDFVIESSGYVQPPGFRMDRKNKAISSNYTALAELLRREGIQL